jgi:antirestriction protein ArdC
VRDVYGLITGKVLEALERGVIPWHRPWSGCLPTNVLSRKAYRGINAFLLSMAPYASPFWLTYKQAEFLGGHVRKGEHGYPIVFWTWLDAASAEEDADETKGRRRPLLRYFTGFNAEQCEGLPAKLVDAPERLRA